MLLKKNFFTSSNWEYIFPILATASLLLSCLIVSSKKFFWNDEILSFYLLNDPSFTHMIVAWGDKFNNAPPFYFILGWLWAKAFGSTELSLRLFSSVGICIALTFVWLTLRRNYGFWATTIGCLSVFCLSELILYHNAEARMYGLFPAVCALGLFQFDVINQKQKCSKKILLVNACIHAAIVLTHLYGILYSGAFLLAFVIRDRYFKIWRSSVYLSVILSWLSLLPCIAPIMNQADLAKPRIWFTPVSATNLLNYLNFSPISSFVILVLLVISALTYIGKTQINERPKFELSSEKPGLNTEIPLLILAVTFLAVPVLAWIITKTVRPMLVDRYIIPTIAISWPILLAFLSSRIFPSLTTSKEISGRSSWHKLFTNQPNLFLLTLILFLIINLIYYAKKVNDYSQRPGINDNRYGYTNLPIAVEAGHDFLPRYYYSSQPNRYFHILDWETAFNNTSSMNATGDYKALDAIKRNYSINSIQSQEFLKKYNRFLVLNESEKVQNWFEARIKNNPAYQVKFLGEVEGDWEPLGVFLVERNKV